VTKPYDGNVPPGKARGQRQLATLGLEHLMTVTESNPPDADDAWSIPLSSARSVWSPRALDDVLADVANHVLWPFLIVSEESGRVYAPYDGGADLFLGSSAERDEMKRKFERWLPKHPSGL
jgi:hypothetical protein